jgi:hypothetical protein
VITKKLIILQPLQAGKSAVRAGLAAPQFPLATAAYIPIGIIAIGHPISFLKDEL